MYIYANTLVICTVCVDPALCNVQDNVALCPSISLHIYIYIQYIYIKIYILCLSPVGLLGTSYGSVSLSQTHTRTDAHTFWQRSHAPIHTLSIVSIKTLTSAWSFEWNWSAHVLYCCPLTARERCITSAIVIVTTRNDAKTLWRTKLDNDDWRHGVEQLSSCGANGWHFTH